VSQPIENQIIAAVVERLKGIRGSANSSYHFDAIVSDEPATEERVRNGLVCVTVLDPVPVPERAPLQHDEYNLPIQIDFFAAQSGASNDPSVDDRVRLMRADIYAALWSDHTFGNLAYHMEFDQPKRIDVGGAIVGRRMVVTIWYRTLRDDPYNQ